MRRLCFVKTFLHFLLIFTPLIVTASSAEPCICKGKAEIPDFKEYKVEEEAGKTPLSASQLVISSEKAMILSNEPDSLITCVDNFTFPGHEKEEELRDKCLVIKDVFSTEYFLNDNVDKTKKQKMQEGWHKLVKNVSKIKLISKKMYHMIAKPMFFIEHELEIFQLWKPDDVHSPIVRLASNAVRQHSVLLIMELGTPLPAYLKQKSKEWEAENGEGKIKKIYKDIEAMVREFVGTLEAFHHKALHMHLKPGNWVYVQRGTEKKEQLKLIDFQNSIKNDWKKDDSPNLDHLIEFVCNSQWNENALVKATGAITASERPSTYASPEHAEACVKAKKAAKPKFKVSHLWRKEAQNARENILAVYRQSLEKITTKSEVWSLGILIIEVLAQTPPILNLVTKISGTRTKFLSSIGHKTPEEQTKAEAFETLRAFFLKQRLNHGNQRKLAIKMGDAVATMFPRINRILLEMIFIRFPENRSKLVAIRESWMMGRRKKHLLKNEQCAQRENTSEKQEPHEKIHGSTFFCSIQLFITFCITYLSFLGY